VLCRIEDGAIDAAALGPFKKYAYGHGREKEKVSQRNGPLSG